MEDSAEAVAVKISRYPLFVPRSNHSLRNFRERYSRKFRFKYRDVVLRCISNEADKFVSPRSKRKIYIKISKVSRARNTAHPSKCIFKRRNHPAQGNNTKITLTLLSSHIERSKKNHHHHVKAKAIDLCRSFDCCWYQE